MGGSTTHSAFADTNRAFTMNGIFGRLMQRESQSSKDWSDRDLQALAEDLAISMLQGIDDRDDLAIRLEVLLLLGGDEGP